MELELDKYVELEFKRMKMEERLMEMANERRKEDREFQLRMFSMMSQGPLPFPSMTPPHYIQSHKIIQTVYFSTDLKSISRITITWYITSVITKLILNQ